MNKLREFQASVARILADHRSDTTKLVAQLKQLSPEELLRLKPSIWDNISSKTYREIVQAVAPELRIQEPLIEGAGRRFRSSLSFWLRVPRAVRTLTTLSAIAAVSISLTELVAPVVTYAVAPMFLKRSEDVSLWPVCRRLSVTVDGCRYMPQRPVGLDEIARDTGISIDQLINSNLQLSSQTVAPGAILVLWRYRGTILRSVR